MKDKYKGQRCFLIGNGPSMKKTNLKLIDGEMKAGMNLLYKSGIKTDFHFIAGYRIPMNKTDEIQQLNNETTLFLACSAGRWWLKNMKTVPPLILQDFGEIDTWKDFPLDITRGIRGGQTVSAVALQALLYLGFKEVYLLGHDCDYTSNGQYFIKNMTLPAIRLKLPILMITGVQTPIRRSFCCFTAVPSG